MEINSIDIVESVFQSTAAQCPRFQSCNAPICPMDNHWRFARHLKGEAACYFLKDLMKLQRAGETIPSDPPYTAAIGAWSNRDQLPPTLVQQLLKAAESPRKQPPTRKGVDPQKADKAMQRLRQAFGEIDLTSKVGFNNRCGGALYGVAANVLPPA